MGKVGLVLTSVIVVGETALPSAVSTAVGGGGCWICGGWMAALRWRRRRLLAMVG